MNKENAKKEIFNKVKEYYQNFHQEEPFIAGKSKIKYAGRVYDEKEMINLVDSALDFWLTAGKYAEKFEKRFAEFIGVRHCLLTNSGSSANLLAMSALTSPLLGDRRCKKGDEVITVAAAFPTTVNPIIQNNLVPVFVDIDLDTLNIDVDSIEDAITEKTKAIFIAHTLGNPFNLDVIMDLEEKYDFWIIEDACDCLGSKYRGQMVGSFGDLSTYSYFPPHIITCGEGGAVCTNNNLLNKIVMSLRDWGRDCHCATGQDNACGKRFNGQFGTLPAGYDHKYTYSHIGYNLKATDMQASILVAQLDKLPSFIEARKKNYDLLFKGLVKYSKYFRFQIPTVNSNPSWFGFSLVVKDNAPFTRNEIVQYLEGKKITTRMLFSGNIIRHPIFRDVEYKVHGMLKNTDVIMNNQFWIGVYPRMTEEMIDYIIKTFDEFIDGYK